MNKYIYHTLFVSLLLVSQTNLVWGGSSYEKEYRADIDGLKDQLIAEKWAKLQCTEARKCFLRAKCDVKYLTIPPISCVYKKTNLNCDEEKKLCTGSVTFTISLSGVVISPDSVALEKDCECDGELLVTLSSFGTTAHVEEGFCSVTIEWETATEIDTVGFNIWRAQVKDGEYINITKVNNQLVGIKAENDYQGASYSYKDHDVVFGNTYYYVLEDIDFSGLSTVHYNFKDSATVQPPLVVNP